MVINVLFVALNLVGAGVFLALVLSARAIGADDENPLVAFRIGVTTISATLGFARCIMICIGTLRRPSLPC